MIGYVMSIDENNRRLVVSKDSEINANGDEIFNAAWFSEMETVDVGELVRVEYTLMMFSYPGQSSADEVLIYSAYMAKGATFNVKQVLQQILPVDLSLPALLDIHFDHTLRLWHITLTEAERFHNQERPVLPFTVQDALM